MHLILRHLDSAAQALLALSSGLRWKFGSMLTGGAAALPNQHQVETGVTGVLEAQLCKEIEPFSGF